MSTVLVEPHYLPSLEFFSAVSMADTIFLDVESRYRKQTYRNRAVILGPNGPKALIVPVNAGNEMQMKDVRVDYRQSWIRDHWGAFYSSYGKAPFFDHFETYFRREWDRKYEFLIDLNVAMLSVCQKIIGWNKNLVLGSKDAENDLRDHLLAKKSYSERNIYQPVEYFQNFGNTFVPNLSILDLLLCQGPEAINIINQSAKNR